MMNNAQNISVSVIMPVYNVEPYIRKCLDTLLLQTLKNIEVIAIDDGSDDNSYGILKEYAERDSRMTVMKNPYNIGAARTRNIGIQLARGKYVAILDSDDFFELDFLKKMFERAEATKTDLVLCNIYTYDNVTGADSFQPLPEFLLEKIRLPFTPAAIAKHIFSTFWDTPFNKLILRSMLMDSMIMFQDIPVANDVFFGMSILIYSKLISYIDTPLIHYRSAWGGNISSRRHQAVINVYKSMKKVYELIKSNHAFTIYKLSYHTRVIEAVLGNHSILTEKEWKSFLNFWKQKGFSSIGMVNLCNRNFLSKKYFLQWEMMSTEGRFTPDLPRILFRDVYETFFKELVLRDLHVAIWGYGKEGKHFIRMANMCYFTLMEAYDRDESKYQGGAVPVKSFVHRNLAVDTIIVTNIKWTREIAAEAWGQDNSIRIFDFAAYLWYGATFEECEYKRI